MPKFSVKKPLTVFMAVLAVIILGVVAYLKMTPDLMPNMNFPYVIIITTDPGASPEAVEAEVTRPMEQAMATLDQIKSVTSTSQNSVSMVALEFEDGVNMDSISVDIQQKINSLSAAWDDMIQLLPSSYNQMRTVTMNYENLINMYYARKNHKLAEWHVFCDWIKILPYSELIAGEDIFDD